MAIEMVNPASELRPWVQLAIVLVFYLGLRALSGDRAGAQCLLENFPNHFADAAPAMKAAARAEADALTKVSAAAPLR